MIPPKASAAFVARMEDPLALYADPYEPERPVVCLAETPVRLLSHARAPPACSPRSTSREEGG